MAADQAKSLDGMRSAGLHHRHPVKDLQNSAHQRGPTPRAHLTGAEGVATGDLAASRTTTLGLELEIAEGVAHKDSAIRTGGTALVAAFRRAGSAGLSSGEEAESEEDTRKVHVG